MLKKIKNMSKKKKFFLILVILIIAALIAYFITGGPKAATAALMEATAARENISTYYSFTGNIESHDVQNVQSKSSEPVKNLYVKEGDKVSAGDLLYDVDSNTIESTMTQANTSLSNANNEYASAELNYQRMQTLYDSGGISLQELENAESSYTSAQNQVEQAKASYQQAQKQYEDTRRYAEISGEVSKVYIKENESLTIGTNIMDIVDYENLEINIKVDEYNLADISEGMEADVYIEALGTHFTGTISEIAKSATIESGVSYFVATVVLPQDDTLRIGLTADVQITTESAENAIAVPVGAVAYQGEDTFVQYYDSEGSLATKPVTVGINNGKMIEIKDGLSEGDKVVMSAVSTGESASSQPAAGMPSGGMPGGGGPSGGDSGSPSGSPAM